MRVLSCMIGLAALALAQGPSDSADGRKLFELKCGICHSEGSDKRIGPGLKGAKDGKLSDGRNATHAVILKQINEGGGGMPVFRDLLTEDQKERIIGYVLTL